MNEIPLPKIDPSKFNCHYKIENWKCCALLFVTVKSWIVESRQSFFRINNYFSGWSTHQEKKLLRKFLCHSLNQTQNPNQRRESIIDWVCHCWFKHISIKIADNSQTWLFAQATPLRYGFLPRVHGNCIIVLKMRVRIFLGWLHSNKLMFAICGFISRWNF